MAAIELAWADGGYHGFCAYGGSWAAVTSAGDLLTGDTPDALIAPGSCLVISVACHDDEALRKRLSAEYTAATWHNHSLQDVDSFLAGLEPVGPGITEAQTWRAWMPQPVMRRREGHVLAGVARKP